MAEAEKKNGMGKTILMVLFILLFVAAAAAAGYFYWQYRTTQKLLKSPTVAAQQEAQDLMDKVGKLIELPKNEVPTIATVNDATKLKDQPFFATAKNGDKVLIYTIAKKAILYRPSENKIIEVGPVNIAQNPSPTVTSPTPAKKVTPTKTPTPTEVIQQ